MKSAAVMAKKEALKKLIRHMRKLELADAAEEAEEGPGQAGVGDEEEILEPHMGPLEEPPAPGHALEDDEDDPKAELGRFMRRGMNHAPRGRATVTIAVGHEPKKGSTMKSKGKY